MSKRNRLVISFLIAFIVGFALFPAIAKMIENNNCQQDANMLLECSDPSIVDK